MLPIGGVMARVTPKQRGDLVVEPGDPRKDEVVSITGRLTPTVGGQRVRVEFEDPKGSRRFVNTETASDGTFVAALSRRELEVGDLDAGMWKVVARVINARNIAACAADPVFVAVS